VDLWCLSGTSTFQDAVILLSWNCCSKEPIRAKCRHPRREDSKYCIFASVRFTALEGLDRVVDSVRCASVSSHHLGAYNDGF
jgi:hypothetical protein